MNITASCEPMIREQGGNFLTRKHLRAFGLIVLIVVSALVRTTAQEPQASALVNAHAHNDYQHKRPLFDALDQGFCSVEADIHLVDRQLLVAHDRSAVKPERTLQALYLDPLRAQARKNRGRIYRDSPVFYLLIDVKANAEATYAVLREVLKQYADILTEFQGNKLRKRAVTVVISGARATETMKAEKRRFAGIDGQIADLESGSPPTVFPWISDDWNTQFKWWGFGTFPENEKQKLKTLVETAHKHGYRIRFWGAPNSEAIWRVQQEAGVDLLNADNLAGLRAFLLKPKTPPENAPH